MRQVGVLVMGFGVGLATPVGLKHLIGGILMLIGIMVYIQARLEEEL